MRFDSSGLPNRRFRLETPGICAKLAAKRRFRMIRRATGLIWASLLLLPLVLPSSGLGHGPQEGGERIDDASFWGMFSQFSEPNGYFHSDNLVSNERTFPAILDEVGHRAAADTVYLGVGPEQNFSYLAALKPRIAFVVDIRRQNAVLHLMYKAIFELSPDRAEFLSRLFSRPRPRGLAASSSAPELMEAFAGTVAERRRFESNLRDIRSRLLKTHRFALTPEDLEGLEAVYSAFFESGPEVQYSFGSSRQWRRFPTFAELMTAADDQGRPRSFLASEEAYRVLRNLQERNLIIPVVGDFGGPKALRAVGAYLNGRGLTVRVFYTSNVESYLFRGDDWKGFYENVSSLPIDSGSILIRSLSGRGFWSYGGGLPPSGGLGNLQLDPIEDLVATFRRGEISSYESVVLRR